MTSILLVAATAAEIAPLPKTWPAGVQVEVLISGVGMVATTASLTKKLGEKGFDLAIQAGIAGSFRRDIQPGDVFEVTEDRFSELGAEDGESFLPIEELGFGSGCATPLKPFSPGIFPQIALPAADAITVNTVHGNERTIELLRHRFPVALESMEGAAFFYVCELFKQPCLQIRAVSNYVERRNRANWNIGLAVKNLNNTLGELLSRFA
ncbi:MAG: futalosine hydrolase [Mucilaginibacter polytrichastri]|nr:futalosine hydrolase [Mucilaginibacter polytrichastri]